MGEVSCAVHRIARHCEGSVFDPGCPFFASFLWASKEMKGFCATGTCLREVRSLPALRWFIGIIRGKKAQRQKAQRHKVGNTNSSTGSLSLKKWRGNALQASPQWRLNPGDPVNPAQGSETPCAGKLRIFIRLKRDAVSLFERAHFAVQGEFIPKGPDTDIEDFRGCRTVAALRLKCFQYEFAFHFGDGYRR